MGAIVGSKVHGFKGSRVQGFKGSKVQRFKVQGSRFKEAPEGVESAA
jgi:hypothetical protein